MTTPGRIWLIPPGMFIGKLVIEGVTSYTESYKTHKCV